MADNPSAYALDSLALLAYLKDEPGRHRVEELLAGARSGKCTIYLSIINLAEVLRITEREQGLFVTHRVLAAIDQLPLRIVEGSRAAALAAAHVMAHHPLSCAGAFALVTAQDHGGVLLAGDPEFRSVADGGLVPVEWLAHS